MYDSFKKKIFRIDTTLFMQFSTLIYHLQKMSTNIWGKDKTTIIEKFTGVGDFFTRKEKQPKKESERYSGNFNSLFRIFKK